METGINKFIIDKEEIYELVDGVITFWTKKGCPPTKLYFETGEDGQTTTEFQGISGMQLLGLAHLLSEWSASNNVKDPMLVAIRVGMIARILTEFKEDFNKDKNDGLVIKFNTKEGKDGNTTPEDL